jgi:hypothetical protein
MTIRQSDFYIGIEDLVTPELPFDLMGWQDNKYGEHPIKYRISYFHYLLCEKLTSVFGVSMYALSRGLISLGEIALAKKYGLCEGQVKTVEIACTGSRKEHNRKLLNVALKGIELVMCSKRAMVELTGMSLKYNHNKYIKMLPATLGESMLLSPQANLEISKELIKLCRGITKMPLNDNMFKLKRDKGNCKGNTRVSSTIDLINQVFQQQVRPKDSRSECYRGAFVTGLYILSSWLNKGKLSGIDEIHLGAIIHDLRMIITDYRNYNT